ncbi:MAG: metallophosphoesterase [Tannerellaceae bacterium]|jgi:predicted MPP superfamily phosphohydrolase|nr:metallophosphoesterase [Tannerellaceae bacterium]
MRPSILLAVIFLAVVIGLHYYVLHRLGQLVPSPAGRITVIALGFAAICMFFLHFFLGDIVNPAVIKVFYRVGGSWLVIFLYLFLIFIIADILRLLPFIPSGWILPRGWTSFFSLLAFIALILIAGSFNYRNKQRVELNLPITKAGGAMRELTVVAMSDLHLGGAVGKKEFESWLPLINAEKPDIILIAGDIVDSRLRPLIEENFAESLRKLSAPLGVYASVGNHEFIANVDRCVDFLESADITVLRDSAVLINNSFYLAARDDHSNRNRKPLAEIIAAVDKAKPVILLDHQPHNLEEAAQNGIDLQISGHTHNGQVWPMSIFTGRMFEKVHGYIKKGATHIYVSSGIGIWGGKFRIGSRSEYVVGKILFDRLEP